MRFNLKIIIAIIASLFFSNTLISQDLNKIKEKGVIKIGFDESEVGKINYKLAYKFADYLDLEVQEVIVDWDALFSKNGKIPENIQTDTSLKYTPDAFKNIDLYSGSVSPVEWRKKLFDFAPTLVSAEVLIINKSMINKPKAISQIGGMTIAMMDGTSFVTHMNEHMKKIKGEVVFEYTETGAASKQLLIDGKVDGIILDASDALTFIKENDGHFEIAFPISSITKLVWAVEKGNELKYEVENFFKFIQNNGYLDELFMSEYSTEYSKFAEKIKPKSAIQKYHRDLDEILKSKKIVVGLRERDFVYHKDGPKQFMHILAEEFADYLGVEFEYVVIPEFKMYWSDKNGKLTKDSSYTPDIYNYFDLACDIFAPLDWRKRKVDLIPVYETDYAILAKKSTEINTKADLLKYKPVTAKATMYETLLKDIGVKNIEYTSINKMVPSVVRGKGDYTLIYNAFLYPELEPKISMGTTTVNWGLRNDQPELKKALLSFINESANNGLLNALSKISEGKVLTNVEEFLNNYYQSAQKGTLPHILVGTEQGLPQEDVNDILQDEKGYIWFATLSGVVKYNGEKMLLFNTKNGLIDNNTFALATYNNNDILVATAKGLSVISNNKIKNYELDYAVKDIFIDKNQIAWLNTDKGLFKFENGDISKFNIDLKATGNINSISDDTSNFRYIIAAENGLFSFTKNSNSLKPLLKKEVYYALIDDKEYLWYSTKDGLYYECLGDFCENKTAIKVNKQIEVPETRIIQIKQSESGIIWLVNTRNVYQVSSVQQKAIKYETGNDLINNNILSFLEDREGNIWIGFSGGLQKIINNKSLRNFYPDIINHSVSSVNIDNYENIYISTNKWIYYYNAEKNRLSIINDELGLEQGQSIIRKLKNSNEYVVVKASGIFFINPEEMKVNKKIEYRIQNPNIAFVSDNDEVFIGTGDFGKLYYLKNKNSNIKVFENDYTKNISDINQNGESILISNQNKIQAFKNGEFEVVYEFKNKVSSFIATEKEIWVGTNKGIHTFNNPEAFTSFGKNVIIKDIIASRSRNHLWVGTNKGVYYFNKESKKNDLSLSSKDGIKGNEIVDNGLFLDEKGILWVSTYHGLSNFNLKSNIDIKYSPKCYLDSIIVNGRSIGINDFSKLKYNENNITFNFSALFFSDESSVIYEHYLRGKKGDYNFIRTDKDNSVYYNNLNPGKYELVYRAKGKDGVWSPSASFEFRIAKPFWNTWLFRIAAVLIISFVLYSIYKIRVKQIEKQKQRLEDLVNQRTKELQNANNEITSKNKQITDSIHYAERIQQSLLPKHRMFEESFSDYFVLFKPRDIVSGDFYWSYKLDNKIIITAADCTGHGVPGAFMSMLGMSFLKEIVSKSEITDPAQILNELRTEVIRALQQEGKIDEAKDGMDMSVITFDTKTKTLEFAGANNALYIIKNRQELIIKDKRVKQRAAGFYEVKPDKMPIAIYEKMDDFKTFKVSLEKGDRAFIFSDGYADQFGGPKNKKFKYPNFRKLLKKDLSVNMDNMHTELEKAFEEWKSGYPQVDDVTVIGIEV